MELKRVVVTGLGAITPIGNSVPEFWENLVNGVSGAGPITHFDASLFKTQFACEVKDFDATKYSLEYDKLASFPKTGESGKIYVAQDSNKTYRWSGTAYVEISASLAFDRLPRRLRQDCI